jgi:ABC-type molybdate transport system substrate-binding protein
MRIQTLPVAFVVLALAAGCASGGSGTAAATPSIKSRVSMSFAPAANAKKVIVSVDGSASRAITIANKAQTATLADNVAISIDCQTQSGGSAAGASTSSGSGETCTLLTLLPPGQHEISVSQLDFLDALINDLNQLISLAAGSDFFGDFFGPSPFGPTSPSPIATSSASP